MNCIEVPLLSLAGIVEQVMRAVLFNNHNHIAKTKEFCQVFLV